MRHSVRILAAACLLSAVPAARARDDVQLWLASWVTTGLTDTWSLQVYSESWFRNDAHDHFLYNLDAGAIHRTADHLRLGIHVRQQQVRTSGGWLNENRLHGNATLVWKWKGLSFTDRNRVEARFREKRSDILRYRNRLKITFPAITGRGAVRPFLFDEFFIDTDGEKVDQNRLAAGWTTRIHPRADLHTYYLLRSVDAGDWAHHHVAGLSLALAF